MDDTNIELIERVAVLETQMATLIVDRQEDRKEHQKDREALLLLVKKLERYEGMWGGVLAIGAAILAFVKIVLPYFWTSKGG